MLTSWDECILRQGQTTEALFQQGKSTTSKADGDLQWFPDTSYWDVEELQREAGHLNFKLASKWSVDRVTCFYCLVERFIMEKERYRIRSRWQFDNLPLSTLINYANQTIEFDNWSSRVVDGSGEFEQLDVSEDGKYTLKYACKVRLSLEDGTEVTKTGRAKIDSVGNKGIAFASAQKQAYTNGLKQCFYGLIELLLDYEEKVKMLFYDKYQ